MIPPVYSPLSARAIGAAFRAAARGDAGARERVARALEAFHGSGRAILTDSGTTALTLAMKWCLGVNGRRAIALPAFCCYDLVTALRGAGAEPVFYDLDPATLGPAWDSFERAIAARPAAVVVAHLYGLPVDMVRVLELTEGTGVTVVEDAAQGSGATLHRRPVGSFGQLAVLSFGRGKGVTGGRGGALLVNAGWRGGVDESPLLPGLRGVPEVVPLLAQWILARPSLYRIPASLPFLGLGETVYREPRALRRISDVSAAVVEVSWREREAEIHRRKHAASLLLTAARADSRRAIEPVTGADPGWLRFPLLAGPQDSLRSGDGVMRSFPRLLPGLLGSGGAGDQPGYAGGLRLAGELQTLPTHGLMRPEDLSSLGRTVATITSCSRSAE